MSRRVTVTMAVLLCAAASGCGSHHESGSVAGDYRLVGGPAPGINRPIQGTVWAFSGRVTWDHASSSTAVAHARTDPDGHFGLHLPEGEFTLFGSQGTSDAFPSDGCGSPVVVDVHSSQSQTVHLVCAVP